MRSIVSVVLMCVLGAGVTASGVPGSAAGDFNDGVTLNGHRVPANTAVFPGDKISTDRNGLAHLSKPGLVVLIAKDSSAELFAGGLRVLKGEAEATLGKGGVIEYAGLHIRAASDTARVRIVARQGVEMIAALAGDLRVDNSSSDVAVPQGQALYAKAVVPEVPDTYRLPQPAVFHRPPIIPGWAMAAVGGGASLGGALYGLEVTGAIGTSPVSPSRP